jgi:hypothetical protein
VFFDGQADFSTPDEAWSGAGETIQSSLEWLNSFLASFQRKVPYLVASHIYPVPSVVAVTLAEKTRGRQGVDQSAAEAENSRRVVAAAVDGCAAS